MMTRRRRALLFIYNNQIDTLVYTNSSLLCGPPDCAIPHGHAPRQLLSIYCALFTCLGPSDYPCTACEPGTVAEVWETASGHGQAVYLAAGPGMRSFKCTSAHFQVTSGHTTHTAHTNPANFPRAR